MNKTEIIQQVIAASGDTPTVFTTGYCCRIAQHIDDKPGHFYMVGSMGLACCIAVGLAASLAKPVIVVDGDGALAMNPGELMLASQFATLPLIHLVLDDQVYSSTGGQPTPSIGNFEAWAASLGYRMFGTGGASATELATLITELLAVGIDRPHLLRLEVEGDRRDVPPRIEGSLAGYASRFRAHCSSLRDLHAVARLEKKEGRRARDSRAAG